VEINRGDAALPWGWGLEAVSAYIQDRVRTRLNMCASLDPIRGYQDQERDSRGSPGSVNRPRLASSVAGLSIGAATLADR
jgi:hypothetical protein